MTQIDCAQNYELAQELTEFLYNENYTVTQENDVITSNQKIPKSVMKKFLKETNRPKHKISLLESYSFVIAISVDLEDIGLESCEFCGYTDHRELVNVHRRTHQGI